jgi:serine/threonine protein kinase
LKEKKILDQINKVIDQSARKHIVKIVDGFSERKEMFLISELMDGNLSNELIDYSDLEDILIDLTIALHALHKNGYVHFDIRPGKIN